MAQIPGSANLDLDRFSFYGAIIHGSLTCVFSSSHNSADECLQLFHLAGGLECPKCKGCPRTIFQHKYLPIGTGMTSAHATGTNATGVGSIKKRAKFSVVDFVWFYMECGETITGRYPVALGKWGPLSPATVLVEQGIEPHPGPSKVKVMSHNIRGLRQHMNGVALDERSVLALQECDLPEH